jgi:hypothetical protein
MKTYRAFFVSVFVAGVLLFAGCEAFIPVTPPPPKMKPPFAYESLGVRNSCFVESVHFYDVYTAWRAEGDASWVRVLQWGNQEGDYKISSGHAVAVYVAKGKLCGYDINFGFWPIDVPVEKRADLTEVGPKVFVHYPQFKPVFARYRKDFQQQSPTKPPDFLFYHAKQDVRDVTRVASELGRYRPVSVVEFNYQENGVRQESAAAVFVFGGRLCVYLPRGGTHISRPLVRAFHDLNLASYVIRRLYPGATDIRPQPGGYLLFPPKN